MEKLLRAVKDNAAEIAAAENRARTKLAKRLETQRKEQERACSGEAVFDPEFSRALKDSGIDTAATMDRKLLLKQAREIAKYLALHNPQRIVNADQIQIALIRGVHGHNTKASALIAGNIFRGSENCWENTGISFISFRRSTKSRLLYWWRYAGT